MSAIYEQVFDDTTGIRIVTKPNEKLKKETLWFQLRVSTGPSTVKMIQFELVDKDSGVDLSEEFFDAVLQHKIKDIGRQCERCEKYFLPLSPNQKRCDKCREAS